MLFSIKLVKVKKIDWDRSYELKLSKRHIVTFLYICDF